LKGTPDEESESDCEVTEETIEKNEMVTMVFMMIRRISWFIGSISFNLIHIKSEELTLEQIKEETSDQKMTRLLMESKILSGGIENRFLSTFAQETKDKLKPVLEISGSTKILEMLESKDATLNKEDQLLVEVLKPGTSELTDLLL
jgi:hypothetical protein